MNENDLSGIERLQEAFRRHDRLYLEKYPPITKRRISKRVLTALLAATILICGTLCISASKEPLSNFMHHLYQGFIEFFFEESSPPDKTKYTISALPTGYTLLEEYRGESEYKQIWRNESGDLIVLLQLPFDAKITLDSENSEQKALDVDGISVICFEKHEKRVYYWAGETYVFTLTVPNLLSEKEGLALVRSLSTKIEE